MWNYEKRLEYPVNITRCDPKAAMVIISQYGGPDGEIGASMRYLSQRYSMENRIAAGTLTDIGTEELAHSCWKYIPIPEFLLAFPLQSSGSVPQCPDASTLPMLRKF